MKTTRRSLLQALAGLLAGAKAVEARDWDDWEDDLYPEEELDDLPHWTPPVSPYARVYAVSMVRIVEVGIPKAVCGEMLAQFVGPEYVADLVLHRTAADLTGQIGEPQPLMFLQHEMSVLASRDVVYQNDEETHRIAGLVIYRADDRTLVTWTPFEEVVISPHHSMTVVHGTPGVLTIS